MIRILSVGLMALGATAMCPFGYGSSKKAGEAPMPTREERTPDMAYQAAAEALDWAAVRTDIRAVLNKSQAWWPADWGHYGGLVMRLAWHQAGSYRMEDGMGGSDGGRMRFDPERSWRDNTNLDKARRLLTPIKRKYGKGLSWGDLFILTGTEAIEDLGGPVLGFCAGRADDDDGWWSHFLGPGDFQEEETPCPVDGDCQNTGSVSIGLIYVNPAGPFGNPYDVQGSADNVRDTFARMAMNDEETVALVGGGHAFGKMHGACPLGAGDAPKDNERNPWEGLCGTGRGIDTATSGFEGPWTSQPTVWDNEYFKLLLDYQWTVVNSTGGNPQYRIDTRKHKNPPAAVGAHVKSIPEPVTMSTADFSLQHDPAYRVIVDKFAKDQKALDVAFEEAWYKLMTRDMGPRSRCIQGAKGITLPTARAFQRPLPAPAAKLANMDAVTLDILPLLNAATGPAFMNLAISCAQTFRVSDYAGGCNGARVRFANGGTQAHTKDQLAINILAPVYQKYNALHADSLTWADLIVLAGSVALQQAAATTCGGAVEVPFCPGRTDASGPGDGESVLGFARRVTLSKTLTVAQLEYAAILMGLSKRETVALLGLGSYGSLGAHWLVESSDAQVARLLAPLSHTGNSKVLDNSYFVNLLDLTYTEKTYTVPSIAAGKLTAYDATDRDGNSVATLRIDQVLLEDAEYHNIVVDFATDVDYFLEEAAGVFVKMMNADRFDGPTRNLCYPAPSTYGTPVKAKCNQVFKMYPRSQAQDAADYCNNMTTNCMTTTNKSGKTTCRKVKCTHLKSEHLCRLKQCNAVYHSGSGKFRKCQ